MCAAIAGVTLAEDFLSILRPYIGRWKRVDITL